MASKKADTSVAGTILASWLGPREATAGAVEEVEGRG